MQYGWSKEKNYKNAASKIKEPKKFEGYSQNNVWVRNRKAKIAEYYEKNV